MAVKYKDYKCSTKADNSSILVIIFDKIYVRNN